MFFRCDFFLSRLTKGAVFVLGVGCLLLVIAYLEADWRGARNSEECQQQLEAKGEILDLRQLAPPDTSEGDLSKVPIFAEIYQQPPPRYIGFIRQDVPKPTRLGRISVYLGTNVFAKYPDTKNYLDGHAFDLKSWQDFYRPLPQAHLLATMATPAQDVLQALTQFDLEMSEVTAALSNPDAYWPINYENPWNAKIGGLTNTLSIARVLQLRAVAHLENQQVDLAEKDYLDSFKFNRPLVHSPLLINYLIAIGVRALDDSILWEGIHRHAWNDTQLKQMEAALASSDTLALAAKTLRLERAYALNTMNLTEA